MKNVMMKYWICVWNIKLQKGYLDMKSAYSAIYV